MNALQFFDHDANTLFFHNETFSFQPDQDIEMPKKETNALDNDTKYDIPEDTEMKNSIEANGNDQNNIQQHTHLNRIISHFNYWQPHQAQGPIFDIIVIHAGQFKPLSNYDEFILKQFNIPIRYLNLLNTFIIVQFI